MDRLISQLNGSCAQHNTSQVVYAHDAARVASMREFCSLVRFWKPRPLQCPNNSSRQLPDMSPFLCFSHLPFGLFLCECRTLGPSGLCTHFAVTTTTVAYARWLLYAQGRRVRLGLVRQTYALSLPFCSRCWYGCSELVSLSTFASIVEHASIIITMPSSQPVVRLPRLPPLSWPRTLRLPLLRTAPAYQGLLLLLPPPLLTTLPPATRLL